jgi:4-amino-4-deoxy-L-arabinose transferase-like glycosyltransferase
MKNILFKFGLPALTLLAFFILLGNRPLNEPDEGRYSEIAREMIETGDWLVPHFWYLPHLDKPPLTYWLVAVSMKIFGQNEWAVRLPVALAAISGVWAAFCLGYAVGGRRVGLWSALILQTSMFYWFMGRMLTTDMLLTQSTAWAIYFFWRSWTALPTRKRGEFFTWHLVGWVAIAFGFMTKGPIALAIPLAAFAALLFFRRKEIPGTVYTGLVAGLILFFSLAAPWFLVVFQQVPHAAHFMILGQAAGHLLGTTIKDRSAVPGFFFLMLAWELLPWTLLLGWLWRREHWRSLEPGAKEAWVLLNTWVIFTFTLFSFSHAKLATYILPIYPALAVMLAWKFFGDDREYVPKILWRFILVLPLLGLAIFPFVVFFLLHDKLPLWLECQVPLALALMVFVSLLARQWKRQTIAAVLVGLTLLAGFTTMGEFPLFNFDFRANQPLDQMGLALRKNFQPGDAIVCWHGLPQGLPFYTGGIISATNRPYFGYLDLTKEPFAFPLNRERFGQLYLDENGLADLLHQNHGTLIVGYGSAVGDFEKDHADISLRLVMRSGRWSLYSNDHNPAPENGGNF